MKENTSIKGIRRKKKVQYTCNLSSKRRGEKVVKVIVQHIISETIPKEKRQFLQGSKN